MSNSSAAVRKVSGQQGFTLLELLVVVAILAAVAFVAGGTFLGVREQANDQMVRTEMQEIAKALRRFKQDTGYYPKEGPFGLIGFGSGMIPDADIRSQKPYAGSDPGARARWFYSPANFYQLLSSASPLAGTGHRLENWDPETGRGWRGPYLGGFKEGFVDIGDEINQTWNGDPLGGGAIPDVDGLADPFELSSRTGGGSAVDNTLLDWSMSHRFDDLGRRGRERWGRPYLYLRKGAHGPRFLISMGPDGEYGTDDDVELFIE